MNGCDFIDNDNIRYECKSRQKMFSKSRNGCTKEIILKNFYRKSEPISHQTFDHMIMMDSTENSIGVVDYETAIKYSNITDSIITTKIALNEINYVTEKVVTNNVIDFEQTLNTLIFASI
jgi:homoserine trans-succinylase